MWRGECAELVDPTFAAAVDHEHGQVHIGACSLTSDWFDDEDAAGWAGGLDASGEDAVGVLVVPIVEDVGQQVGVRPGGKRVEEAGPRSPRLGRQGCER